MVKDRYPALAAAYRAQLADIETQTEVSFQTTDDPRRLYKIIQWAEGERQRAWTRWQRALMRAALADIRGGKM